MDKLIQLHRDDNVFIVRARVLAGEAQYIGDQKIVLAQSLEIGHKVAAKDLPAGEKIIKFGVPIGSATVAIAAGAHVHLHNMKSDYITTFTLENEFIGSK